MIVHYQLSLSIANIGRCECDNFFFFYVVVIISVIFFLNVKLNDKTQPTSNY